MKKLLILFGLFAFISCKETPNPAPKTPPIDNPAPKPEPKTVSPGTPIETSDQNNK